MTLPNQAAPVIRQNRFGAVRQHAAAFSFEAVYPADKIPCRPGEACSCGACGEVCCNPNNGCHCSVTGTTCLCN